MVLGLDTDTEFRKICQHINASLGLSMDISDVKMDYSKLRVSWKRDQNNPSLLFQIPKWQKKFELTKREFSKDDLSYWGQYGIREDILKRYGVHSLSSYSSVNDNGPFTIRALPQRLMFAYLQENFVKIYRPLDKKLFLNHFKTAS